MNTTVGFRDKMRLSGGDELTKRAAGAGTAVVMATENMLTPIRVRTRASVCAEMGCKG